MEGMVAYVQRLERGAQSPNTQNQTHYLIF